MQLSAPCSIAARELLGTSAQMLRVRELIARVADTNVTVLIRGESGTGKELVARAIHAGSPRRHRPFIKVNCGGLPAELLESELFGFVRGAFGGALQDKPGKFEFANHGTMFLDEISQLELPLQGKLLQVLHDGAFARLGDHRDVKVDARVVCATNRDLETAVADGQFREDLFFRLNIVCITLPPLRQRRDEIAPLTELFLRHYSAHYNRARFPLATETLHLFAEYHWPGNVRELEGVIKRLVIAGDDTQIRRELAGAIAGPGSAPETLPALPMPEQPLASLKDIGRSAARIAERELIYQTLQQTRWNRREAAAILGISYKALLYKIKEAEHDKAS